MRQFDLSPLYRSTVGFDRLFTMLDQAAGVDQAPTYPPYNIERTGENAYRITLAVAGFGEGDLALESRENTLTIRGSKEVQSEAPAKNEVLYQGIAGRAFERRFQLADHVQVTGASLENGLLHVDLVREIPETQKPRQIPIGKASGPKVVETQKPRNRLVLSAGASSEAPFSRRCVLRASGGVSPSTRSDAVDAATLRRDVWRQTPSGADAQNRCGRRSPRLPTQVP